MRIFKIAITALAAMLLASSCASRYDELLASNDVDEMYKGAFDYFNAGKYQKAASLFEALAVYTNGTAKDDTVQYYWGLSNYKYKDFITAETNFKRFIETYPQSPFTDEAKFYRIDCLYRQTERYELDQVPTYTAMAAIDQYMRESPNSDYKNECRVMRLDLSNRLDRKAYESAKLYYKMEDYKAARVAFKNILKDNADNIYREDILYYIGKSSYKYAQLSVKSKQKDRYLTFIDDYLNFVGEFPDSKYRPEMESLYAKSQKFLGRYNGSEELLNQKEADFEKARKAAEKAEAKKSK